MRKIAVIVSTLYVVIAFVGFIFSLLLPEFETVVNARDNYCYWTNALVAYVECGRNVFGGVVLKALYNLWLMLIYVPVFAAHSMKANLIGYTILLYAPILVLVWRMTRRFFRPR